MMSYVDAPGFKCSKFKLKTRLYVDFSQIQKVTNSVIPSDFPDSNADMLHAAEMQDALQFAPPC